jgi:hypothetical protein
LSETAILVASEIASAGLALVLVYFFSKAYRLTQSVHLLGLPFGFTFLAFSYIFLGTSILYEANSALSEVSLWLRSLLSSYGFAFIAFSYSFSKETLEKTRRFLEIVSSASVISVLLILGGLYIAPPCLELPPNSVADEWFRLANLVFLVYIVYALVRQLGSSRQTISGSVWAPSAFSLLAIGQYSQLIHDIDGSQTAFIFAHIIRIASLLLFISIYYLPEGVPK